jgi:hypothetical protein
MIKAAVSSESLVRTHKVTSCRNPEDHSVRLQVSVKYAVIAESIDLSYIKCFHDLLSVGRLIDITTSL